MIPRKLSEWNVNTIVNLLENRILEDDSFDFKESLPDSRDQKQKDGLKKDCAAFANSFGGFLVFGIKDDKKLLPDERIVGIASNQDFARLFGEYPRACQPSVSWNFLQPPIKLLNGNLIHVVFVPQSLKSPHAVETQAGNVDTSYFYLKRTNKGNECMTVDEIRLMHAQYYERTTKVRALLFEIEHIRTSILQSYVADELSRESYTPHTIDLTIISIAIFDIFLILAEIDTELPAKLVYLKMKINNFNSMRTHLLQKLSLALEAIAEQILVYNEKSKSMSFEILELCKELSTTINAKLTPY